MNDENKKSIVKQAHNLNMAKYTLSPLSIDILHVFLAQIKKEDQSLTRMKFPISFLEKSLNKQIDRRCVDTVTTELLTTIIKVKLDSTKELKTTWCYAAIFDSKDNTLELEISNYLKEYLINLNDKFVLSDYKMLSKLKGFYTKRIYLMISQFASTGIFKIKLEDFKEKLEIENKYDMYSDFKKRILNSSISQINSILNINLIVEEEKIGKRIDTLIFKFNKINEKKEDKDLVEQWLKEEHTIEGNIVK